MSRTDLMWRTATRNRQAHGRDCRDREPMVAEPLSEGGRRVETRRLKRAEVQRDLESRCPDTDSFAATLTENAPTSLRFSKAWKTRRDGS